MRWGRCGDGFGRKTGRCGVHCWSTISAPTILRPHGIEPRYSHLQGSIRRFGGNGSTDTLLLESRISAGWEAGIYAGIALPNVCGWFRACHHHASFLLAMAQQQLQSGRVSSRIEGERLVLVGCVPSWLSPMFNQLLEGPPSPWKWVPACPLASFGQSNMVAP